MIALQLAVLVAFALTCQLVYGLTDAEEQELFAATFNAVDKNQDGKISTEELGDFLRKVDPDLPASELEAKFGELDTDKSKAIELNEFVTFIQKHNGIQAAFRVFDHDNDGFITKEELQKGLNDHGCKKTDELVQEIIKGADTNGDGKISIQELTDLIKASK